MSRAYHHINLTGVFCDNDTRHYLVNVRVHSGCVVHYHRAHGYKSMYLDGCHIEVSQCNDVLISGYIDTMTYALHYCVVIETCLRGGIGIDDCLSAVSIQCHRIHH